jgi:hypothetical protein
MIDPEVDVRAQRCLRSLVAAGIADDPSLLGAGDFSPLMQRGLERFIAQTPPDSRLRPEDIDWRSYRLTDRKLFPDLRAYLHQVDAVGKGMIQLTAMDRRGAVCDFAFLEDATRLKLPYLKNGPGLGRYPWHNVTMFSMNYKVNVLIPQSDGFSFSTRRLGETMDATIKMPRERFTALSAGGVSALMDDLTVVVTNALLLMFADVRPSAVRIMLIEGDDGPRSTHMYGVGMVPQRLRLVDRLVELPR